VVAHLGGACPASPPPSSLSLSHTRTALFTHSLPLSTQVGIFCLGSGVNIVHGAHGLTHPQPVEAILPSLGVLALSLVVEGYSLKVAYEHLQESARRDKLGLWEFVQLGRSARRCTHLSLSLSLSLSLFPTHSPLVPRSPHLTHGHGWRSDPTTAAVLAEDAAAVAGLGIAGACLTAAHLTGLSHYDAAGSVLVGGLLGVTAVHLINVNRNGLLGRSMSPDVCEQILVRRSSVSSVKVGRHSMHTAKLRPQHQQPAASRPGALLALA
jgi:zinc transporter 9